MVPRKQAGHMTCKFLLQRGRRPHMTNPEIARSGGNPAIRWGSCKGSDHMLHANSTIVDRVDLATPLSLSSQPASGPSVLAPAQRAGTQRLCS